MLENGGKLREDAVAKSRKNNLESLGVLASMVAHDLNNILTGILGHVSFLRVSGGVLPTGEDSVAAIEDAARRAALITQKILEQTRGGDKEHGPVDLVPVLHSAANLFRVSLPDSMSIQVDCGELPVFVLGEEVELGQIVMNLLVNARDASLSGGVIRLELGSGVLDDPQFCREKGVRPGAYALIRIVDNGEGIAPETLKKIFEPFFTIKQEKGTGLGLAIVQSIVKALGGVVRVESSVGVGTRFEVFLPLADGKILGQEVPISPAKENSAKSNELPRGSERILVVDDEDAVRIIMQRSLEHLGYQVLAAAAGEEALEIFRQDPGSFHLVVIDMIMPEMSGEELFRQLKAIRPDVPVLIASGYSSDSRTRAILDNGGLGLLRKPFAVEELAQEVRRCLNRI